MVKRRRRWQVAPVAATGDAVPGGAGPSSTAGDDRAPAAPHPSGPVQRLWLLLVQLDRAVWRSTPSFREGRAAARSWEDAAKLVLQAQMAIGGLTRDLPALPDEEDLAASHLVDSARNTLAEVDELEPRGWPQARGLVVEALDASEVATTA